MMMMKSSICLAAYCLTYCYKFSLPGSHPESHTTLVVKSPLALLGCDSFSDTPHVGWNLSGVFLMIRLGEKEDSFS